SDDEQVEVAQRNSGADEAAAHGQNDAGEAGQQAIEAENREKRQREPRPSREANEGASIRLEEIGGPCGTNRAHNAESEGDHADVGRQPLAEQQPDLKAEQSVQERQPRVEQEKAEAHYSEAA